MNKNKFNNQYKIKTARLRIWDYSSTGYYFVTICVKDRKCLLSKIINRKLNLLNIGKIIKKCWLEIPKHFDNIFLDEYSIMPNHFHGIINIDDVQYIKNVNKRRDGACPVSTNQFISLGNIIGSFKSASTNNIHKIYPNFSWQTRYYDHVIRNEIELLKIREYIHDNHLNWNTDNENPKNIKVSGSGSEMK